MTRYAEETYNQADSALKSLQVQSSDLVIDFREQREVRRKQAQIELDARTPTGKKPRFLYASLNIFSRVRNGALVLIWQEVHRHRITGRPVYKYLRVNADGHGDLRLIVARARDFELELVRATEMEARRMRAQWGRWSKIRRESLRAIEMVERKEPAANPSETAHEWVPAAVDEDSD